MITECLAILGVGLAGGLLPLLTRWSHRNLHVALALSTGVFLGAVFLHMLPALPTELPGGDHGHVGEEAAHGHGSMAIWGAVLVGVLAVYLFEALVFRTHDHDELHRHRAVGWATLVGLTIHSLTTGFGLAAAGMEGVAAPVFVAIIAHKAFEAFSLTSVFRLAEFPTKRIVVLVSLFALATPLGVVAGEAVLHSVSEAAVVIALALAAGTFLYVCLCELLPEVFHHREDGALKIALLAAGIGAMVVVAGFEG